MTQSLKAVPCQTSLPLSNSSSCNLCVDALDDCSMRWPLSLTLFQYLRQKVNIKQWNAGARWVCNCDALIDLLGCGLQNGTRHCAGNLDTKIATFEPPLEKGGSFGVGALGWCTDDVRRTAGGGSAVSSPQPLQQLFVQSGMAFHHTKSVLINCTGAPPFCLCVSLIIFLFFFLLSLARQALGSLLLMLMKF